jgi:hypothetical protein
MAFGKIAIQTEDGHLEEYELTQADNLGRSPAG